MSAELEVTAEQREEFATLLHDMHGQYVTEGGCDFHPWRYGWRPGVAPEVDASIVDPLLAKARLAQPTADREALSKFIDTLLDGDCGPGVPDFLADRILGFLRGAQ